MDRQQEAGQGPAPSERPAMFCLGQLAFAAPVAMAGWLLAAGDVSGSMAVAAIATAWGCLAVSVVVGIVGFVRATGERNPLHSLETAPPACAWTGIFLWAVAVATLFMAGEPVIASVTEVLVFLRIGILLGRQRPTGNAIAANQHDRKSEPPAAVANVLMPLQLAGAVWVAFGRSPTWATDIVTTWLWTVTVLLLAGSAISAAVFTFQARISGRHWRQLNPGAARDGMPNNQLAQPVSPEPRSTLRQRVSMWVWRAGHVATAWALWAAGQPSLAALYLTGCLAMISVRTREQRRVHGESAQVDFLARAIDFVIWWPLVAAGAAGAVAMLTPIVLFGAIYDRVTGNAPTAAPIESERDKRVRLARIRRAAASYRLREAFGKPEGFVYFMFSEPHQREHFLGPDGLLAALGDRIVARDYRRAVMGTRNVLNWPAFEQAPEGALLHVNGISNMRRDLPFVAIVPPRGRVQVFRLSQPYRARTRDRGMALKKSEQEIRAAIAVAGL